MGNDEAEESRWSLRLAGSAVVCAVLSASITAPQIRWGQRTLQRFIIREFKDNFSQVVRNLGASRW